MVVSRPYWPRWLVASVTIAVLGGLGRPICCAGAAPPKTPAVSFKDEPAAHALYKKMIEAMRQAESLSYVSDFTAEARGKVLIHGTCRVWLKKPNYFRLEGKRASKKEEGILIGDGNTLWIHWPHGRWKYEVEDPKEYEKTRLNSYMTKPAPPGGHSIGHETGYIGFPMPVIDPSTFHGYTDSLQAYLDGVTALPAESVGTEQCDKIEVSIMKGQRIWQLWVSKRDHLPRRLREVVRLGHDIVVMEEWSSVTLNAEISNTMFAWKPPDGWTQWRLPDSRERLLKPGTKAPDFELASADGGRIKLSDYRGRVIWFYIWRAG